MRMLKLFNYGLILFLVAMLAGKIGYHIGAKQKTQAVATTAMVTTPEASKSTESMIGDDATMSALQRFADTQDVQLRSNIYCIIAAHSSHDDAALGVILREYAKMRLRELQGESFHDPDAPTHSDSSDIQVIPHTTQNLGI